MKNLSSGHVDQGCWSQTPIYVAFHGGKEKSMVYWGGGKSEYIYHQFTHAACSRGMEEWKTVQKIGDMVNRETVNWGTTLHYLLQ